MTGLPPISSVVGSYLAAYESLYKQADVTGTGKIQAGAAAVFLKRSGLKEPVLHKIWECCDTLGVGYLDKQAMIVALKLVALAQMGKEVDMANLSLPAPIPSMNASLPRTSSPTVENAWAVTPEEKARYDGIFDGLSPADNKLSGDKVKPVFMNSQLKVETLSKIWDLSDIDADGLLDRDEFAVAMHLVFKALEKEPTPSTLPPKLMPPSKRKKPASLPGAVGVLPLGQPFKPLNHIAPPGGGLLGADVLRPGSPAGEQSTWVVSSAEKTQADVIFKQIDTDVDGFVGGEEVRPILLQSGVPQPELAQIWNLCDMKQTGKLNSEQFALAMYLVNQAKNGTKPPPQLTPEMIPPTSRPKPSADPDPASQLNDLSTGLVGSGESSFNKEAESITREIDNFAKAKTNLQQDIRDKEEHVKSKIMEVESLQSELEKNQSQIRQLDNHKSEAERKLQELEEQKSKVDGLLAEVQQQCQNTQTIVDELHKQITSQQNAVKNQEEELGRARLELETLRQEELQSEQRKEASKTQQEMLQMNLKQTNDEIVKLQSRINLVREGQQKLSSSIKDYEGALETEASTGELPPVEDLPPLSELTNGSGGRNEDTISNQATAGSSPVSSLSAYSISSEPISRPDEDDPFKGKDPFGEAVTVSASDPFKSEDPFKDGDPFKSTAFTSDPFAGDPFKSSDPFGSEATTTPADPFKGDDPFAGGGLTNGGTDAKPAVSDPFATFDAFGGSGFGGSGTFSKSSSTDNFGGSDPFKTADEGGPALPPKMGRPAQTATSTPSTASAQSSNEAFHPFGSPPQASPSPSSSDPFGGSVSSIKSPSDMFSLSGSATAKSEDPFSTTNTSKPDDDLFASFSSSKLSDGSTAVDPFGASVSSTASDKSSVDMFGAFGLTPGQSEKKDPFAKPGADPFGGSFVDSFDSSKTSTTKVAKGPKTDSTLDPFGGATNSSNPSKDVFGGKSADPFGGSATESKGSDPFGGSSTETKDPFGTAPQKSGGGGGFADFASFGSTKPTEAPSPKTKSDDPVAWALQESIREKRRQDELARKEEEDLQRALSLSRAEAESEA